LLALRLPTSMANAPSTQVAAIATACGRASSLTVSR
jgi:hypothetical protein